MKLGSAATEHVRVLWGCRVNVFLLFQDAAPILTNELKGQQETQTAICLLLFKKKKITEQFLFKYHQIPLSSTSRHNLHQPRRNSAKHYTFETLPALLPPLGCLLHVPNTFSQPCLLSCRMWPLLTLHCCLPSCSQCSAGLQAATTNLVAEPRWGRQRCHSSKASARLLHLPLASPAL